MGSTQKVTDCLVTSSKYRGNRGCTVAHEHQHRGKDASCHAYVFTFALPGDILTAYLQAACHCAFFNDNVKDLIDG